MSRILSDSEEAARLNKVGWVGRGMNIWERSCSQLHNPKCGRQTAIPCDRASPAQLSTSANSIGSFSQDSNFANSTPITSRKSLEPRFLINHQLRRHGCQDNLKNSISMENSWELTSFGFFILWWRDLSWVSFIFFKVFICDLRLATFCPPSPLLSF